MKKIKNCVLISLICLLVHVLLSIPIYGNSAISIINNLMRVSVSTSFSDKLDTALPDGGDDPAEADDNMRRIQGAVQELLNVDHIADKTGTEVSNADSGEHRKILFHAPIASTPTVAADHGDLRTKDVSSKAELHWTDEDENELQLTSKGNNLANATFLTATNEAGDGSVDLIKAGKNVADDTDVAIVPDLTRTATNAAPVEDTDLANKKYADDVGKNIVILTDEKAQNTDGGTFTSGAWRKRTVTEKSDVQSLASVSSSVIVLSAGTYLCRISCPAFGVLNHVARLQNTTGATTLVIGTAEFASSANVVQNRSFIEGIFTVAAGQNVEIQHRCNTTKATSGFGIATNLIAEVYTVATFKKIG